MSQNNYLAPLALKEIIFLGVRYNPTQIQIGSLDQSTFASVHLPHLISSLASHDWDIGGSFTESEIQFWILMAEEQNIQIVILMILLDEFMTGIFFNDLTSCIW